MEHDTNVRCSECGRGCEFYAARDAGWLIASDVLHNEPGRMVIRCPEHIDQPALMLAGQDYSRFERREAATLHATQTVAIVWQGRVVNAFYWVPGGEVRANAPIYLLGLNEEALRAGGFHKRPLSTGEEACMEIEILLSEE